MSIALSIGCDSREALTTLARTLSLPISLRQFWRIEICFDGRQPAEGIPTDFPSFEAARKLAARINDDGLTVCKVTGPFEQAVIDLGAAGKAVSV